ncbi:glycoside hydrolase family 16 protein [Plicaturopsis crispa FD-325 SS-3]|nr:glycoside hydrolase family 16 protein [Plicaturopsis crispa FD-325 SS-3]
MCPCYVALFFLFHIIPRALAADFRIVDTYVGADFLDGWKWETFADPTHGDVNFVDQSTALASNLTFVADDKFVMRADATKVVDPGSGERGRDSVRITSHNDYADSVVVLDIAHMPEGKGTWPAFWTLSKNGPWPNGGEIDIIEGVNENTANLASLHTTPSCSMPPIRAQRGSTVSTDCNTAVAYNQGCGTSFTKPASYGASFNAAGGGWYVMARSAKTGISVWFWGRNDSTVPWSVRDGTAEIHPNPTWGTADAHFALDTCEYGSHFDTHQIVFDLTFCGDWAASAYTKSGYAGSCTDYVNNNPQAFVGAYWEINALRIYTP